MPLSSLSKMSAHSRRPVPSRCAASRFCAYPQAAMDHADFCPTPTRQKLPVVLKPGRGAHHSGHLHLSASGVSHDYLRLRPPPPRRHHLQVPDIDSALMLVHVRGRQRDQRPLCALAPANPPMLRQYWCTHRHPRSGSFRPQGGAARACLRPLPPAPNSVQDAFRAALSASGIRNAPPSIRCATGSADHLLEAGAHFASSKPRFATIPPPRPPFPHTSPPSPPPKPARPWPV